MPVEVDSSWLMIIQCVTAQDFESVTWYWSGIFGRYTRHKEAIVEKVKRVALALGHE